MKHLLATLFFVSVFAHAQIPIVPARMVEETRLPVFAAFQPRAEEQTVVRANVRLLIREVFGFRVVGGVGSQTACPYGFFGTGLSPKYPPSASYR